MIMIMVTAKKYKIKLSIINNKIKSNLYIENIIMKKEE